MKKINIRTPPNFFVFKNYNINSFSDDRKIFLLTFGLCNFAFCTFVFWTFLIICNINFCKYQLNECVKRWNR